MITELAMKNPQGLICHKTQPISVSQHWSSDLSSTFYMRSY